MCEIAGRWCFSGSLFSAEGGHFGGRMQMPNIWIVEALLPKSLNTRAFVRDETTPFRHHMFVIYMGTLMLYYMSPVSDSIERTHVPMKNRHERGKRKAAKKIGPHPVAKGKHVAPRTADDYFSKSERFQDKWSRVTHVISKMRVEGVSLPEASREFGLDPRTVVRWGNPALKKRTNGRYSAKPTDTLLRVLVMPTGDGLREVAVRDSRQASLLAEYWVAVQRYLETGNASAVRKIRRKTIFDADGKRVRLIKDLAELGRLGSAGVLSFESLYAKVG